METVIDSVTTVMGIVLAYFIGAALLLFVFASTVYLAYKWFEIRNRL